MVVTITLEDSDKDLLFEQKEKVIDIISHALSFISDKYNMCISLKTRIPLTD